MNQQCGKILLRKNKPNNFEPIKMLKIKVQMLLIIVWVFFVNFGHLLFQKDVTIRYKQTYNSLFDTMDEEKRFLLKTLINNLEMMLETNQILREMDIFKLSTIQLSKIVRNIKFLPREFVYLYTPKMVICAIGPVLIPLMTFIFKN